MNKKYLYYPEKDVSKEYKRQIEYLKGCEPGTSVCLTRWAIDQLGGEFDDVRKALPLDFSHSWQLDPVRDNIIITRLPDMPKETPDEKQKVDFLGITASVSS